MVNVANLQHLPQNGRKSPLTQRSNFCYLDAGHKQGRITGVAEVLSDRVELEAIWQANPLLRQYLGSNDKTRS